MALGFGFNKQKVLANAEKYVQQGKLSNAIAEYEKILEKEPKDLTVINTIGDLHSRAGDASKASEYYTRVGDAYAQQGFTLRAIAMYKKVTKLDPGSLTMVQKLAELYTQQGLLNDARQQYLVLADSALKRNDHEGAARIFEKMLASDSDNAAVQAKLADIYVRLGKKDQARDLLFKIATSLSDRRSIEPAIDALNRLLAIDATNTEALLLRAKIALNAGETAAGIGFLERIPNIDSLPQGLQLLFRGYLSTQKLDEAEPLARKLFTVHNDSSGIREYATALVTSGHAEPALRIYDEFASTLLAGDSTEVILALQPLIGQLKENAPALVSLRSIFEKAGSNSSIPEINELLAHAYVQSGELEKARDLYKGLAELEPGNPLHMQNYRQVMARLGHDVVAQSADNEQAEKAFFIEELAEQTGPTLQQSYPPATTENITSALTESELYESYNKPQQAIHLLESALAAAPEDVRLNQRLASIYLRNGRSDDAARCYRVLSQIFARVGQTAEANQYSEYAARCGGAAPEIAEQQTFEVSAPESIVEQLPAAIEPSSQAVQHSAEVHEIAADVPAFEITPPESAEEGEAHEIDLSAEWEAALSAEPEEEVETAPAAAEVHLPLAPEPVQEAKLPEPEEAPVSAEAPHPSVISDLLEEIKFYVSQAMLEDGRAALDRLRQLAPSNPEIPALEDQIHEAEKAAAAPPEPTHIDVPVEPAALDENVIENILGGDAPPADFKIAAQAPVAEFAIPSTQESVEPEHIPGVVHELSPLTEEIAQFAGAAEGEPEPVAESRVAEPVAAAEPEPLGHLEAEELEIEEPEPLPAPVVHKAVPEPEPLVAAASSKEDVLSDFVLDLENSLGNDFLAGGNGSAPSPSRLPAGPVPTIPVMPLPSVPSHAAAAISTMPASGSAGAATAVAAAPAPETLGEPEEASPLSDLFAEFKEEVEEGSTEKEDPETHYNLGVAFKEMGLLDEAIGELQKVCTAIERGQTFPQVIQAYTWLAHCFVEKGVPEAAIKWYEKALQVPSEQETRTAVEYELACACEAAGDRNLALKHFLEVYGSNIDYRDVSERIKNLRA